MAYYPWTNLAIRSSRYGNRNNQLQLFLQALQGAGKTFATLAQQGQQNAAANKIMQNMNIANPPRAGLVTNDPNDPRYSAAIQDWAQQNPNVSEAGTPGAPYGQGKAGLDMWLQQLQNQRADDQARAQMMMHGLTFAKDAQAMDIARRTFAYEHPGRFSDKYAAEAYNKVAGVPGNQWGINPALAPKGALPESIVRNLGIIQNANSLSNQYLHAPLETAMSTWGAWKTDPKNPNNMINDQLAARTGQPASISQQDYGMLSTQLPHLQSALGQMQVLRNVGYGPVLDKVIGMHGSNINQSGAAQPSGSMIPPASGVNTNSLSPEEQKLWDWSQRVNPKDIPVDPQLEQRIAAIQEKMYPQPGGMPQRPVDNTSPGNGINPGVPVVAGSTGKNSMPTGSQFIQQSLMNMGEKPKPSNIPPSTTPMISRAMPVEGGYSGIIPTGIPVNPTVPSPATAVNNPNSYYQNINPAWDQFQ